MPRFGPLDIEHLLVEAMEPEDVGTYDPDTDPSSDGWDIDYMDLNSADNTYGDGEPMYLYAWIGIPFGASAGTIAILLVDSADAATWAQAAAGRVATDVNTVPCIDGKAAGGPGLIAKIAIPPGVKRYVSGAVVIAGAAVDVGTITMAFGR